MSNRVARSEGLGLGLLRWGYTHPTIDRTLHTDDDDDDDDSTRLDTGEDEEN